MKVMQATRYQRAILNVPEQFNVLLAGGRGGGKLQCGKTLIPTPSGWSVLKDLNLGDQVLDEHGAPCHITGITRSTPEVAYRLFFDDGSTIDCCGDHEWVTLTNQERLVDSQFRHSNWADRPARTTQQIVDSLDDQHMIPVSPELDALRCERGLLPRQCFRIIGYEVIAPVPMRCLTVDSASHMHLTGEGMIPTHNSVAIMFLMLRHADTYRELAYALFVRESYEAIKQLEEEFELLVLQLYGLGVVKHNKTEHTFTFPHGAKIQFGQLKDQQDYVKYQGKALCDETPIPTPTGWKVLKDIQRGDSVLDEKGLPCTVQGVHLVTPIKSYRLTFGDGCYVDCCGDHQWVTLPFLARRAYEKAQPRKFPEDWAARQTITTQDIADTLRYQGKDNNHAVPTTAPLVLPEVDLGIDPYLLGVWLGDGTSIRSEITTADPEIVSAFEEQGFEVTPRRNASRGKASVYRIGPIEKTDKGPWTKFGQQLHKLNVLGNKHIPAIFLRASAAQRLALLQGLMDSDGYANIRYSSVEFSASNPKLANAVVELARSLGEKPVVTHGMGSYNGKQTKPKFRIRWSPKLPCFRLTRKLSRLNLDPCRPKCNHHRLRTIIKCEEIPARPMRCLMVDSPNHMYLCGEGMIPTHNSYTLLVVDEYGEISNPRWVTLLMSNVRGPKGMPLRTVFAANPGGAQHGYLHGGFIACSTPWDPFVREDGQTWMVCPSTWRDNPNIDHEDYLRKLRAACGNDEDLFKAWDTGDWDIARGAYFAGALDAKIHKINPIMFPVQKLARSFQPFIAMDWGSGAPGVAYICAESPGIVGYPKGSLILCDEIASYDPTDAGLNTGLHWAPSKWADALHEKCKEWDCPPEGVCDESYGIEETLLEKFGDLGLNLVKPKKERIAGWQMMRNMLTSVKKRDGKAGLWMSARCEYLWKTLPFLQRDAKRPEDMDSKGPDHGADACFIAGTTVETGIGPREIQTIRPGDLVQTRAGLQPVERTGMRMQPVYRVDLSDGYSITGTSEHPFFVNGDWKPLRKLTQGDMLTTWQQWTLRLQQTWGRREKPLPFGTGLQKDLPGTLSTESIPGNTANSLSSHSAPASSVATSASLPPVGPQVSMTWAENVSSVVPRFVPTNTQKSCAAPTYVVVLEPVGFAMVYNLQVANQPEYFANGILVHNCRYGVLHLGRWAYSGSTTGYY